MKKIHHFINQQFTLIPGSYKVEYKEFIHQIGTVLKLVPGEKIVIGNGQGVETEAIIEQISKKNILLNLGPVQKNLHELPVSIILYCAIVKRENFEWMVEKTTELGVAHIIPLVTARTIKTQVIMTRLQKIIHEATEQSERGVVPVLHQPILFSECLSSVSPSACAILFDISGKYISNITFNPACISQDKKEINLYIGPEGGWAEEELHQAQQKEIEIGSLGNTILRTETAALTSCFWASRMLE